MVTMVILLVLIVITFIFILGGGLVLLQLFARNPAVSQTKPGESPNPSEKSEKVGFHWSYIALPLLILLASIGLSIYFYGKLPGEVIYRFNSDGSAAAIVSHNGIIMWAILPQLLFTIFTIIIAWGTTKISRLFDQAATAGIKLDTILLVMSNMVVIPQLVLFFTMLNIFSYNSSQTRMGFTWWMGLVVIVVGLIFLGIFFARAIRKMGKQTK